MSTWIKLDNKNELKNIVFSTINLNQIKCISEKVLIKLTALKKINANKHSIKITIDENRNPNVFFKNGERTIYKPINYKVNAGDQLKPISVTFVSDLDLNTLKMFPFYVEYFFRPDKPPTKYMYEGKFQSLATE